MKAVVQVVLLVLLTFTNLELSASEQQYLGPKSFAHISNKWTAIVAAYEPEIKAIDAAFAKIDAAQIKETRYFRGVKYQLGEYKGEPIVIFSTGVSVPNATMTMQMALDYFPIDRVIMMGIAGAINPKYVPGDIAVPERWYFHDEYVYANPKKDGSSEYELPHYYLNMQNTYNNRKDDHAPNYVNFGFIHPNEVSIVKDGWESRRKVPYFSATSELLSQLKTAIAKMPPIKLPSGKAINVDIGGNGVTGSIFVDNAEYREWLRNVYLADVAEMESAAVAQVCDINEVDWIVIRSVSDLAGGQKGKNAENVFDAIASGTGATLLIGLLDELTNK